MVGILFNKKKEEEKEEKISPSEESDEISPDKVFKLVADVDRLKSSVEAESEIRQLNSERFMRVDEEIGELRNMIIDREKDLSNLEVKATKAADLVSEVQPEALMGEVRKFDLKIDSLKGKLESYHELNDTIMEELKDIRRSVKVFRGVDEVRKMLEDAHKDIRTFAKIEGKVESRADKIEETYDDFLKKYQDIDQFKKLADQLTSKFTDYENEFNQIKESNKDLIKKAEFNDFSSKMHDFVSTLENQMKDMNVSVGFIKELKDLVTSLEDEIGSIVAEVGDVKKSLNTSKEEIGKLSSDIASKSGNDELMISALRTEIEGIQKQMEALANKDADLDFMAEERILVLEKSFNELNDKLDNVSEVVQIAADSKNNQNDESSNAVVEGKITALEKSFNELNDRLDGVSEVMQISADVKNSKNDESSNAVVEGKIAALENSIGHLSSQLEDINQALILSIESKSSPINSHLTDRVKELENKLGLADEREKRIAEAVTTVIDIVEKINQRH
ncbi:hypothetical protein BVX95_01020 [archaeon D22]|nr:hypothetical protein BVX95_01020 [archaeon D22]